MYYSIRFIGIYGTIKTKWHFLKKKIASTTANRLSFRIGLILPQSNSLTSANSKTFFTVEF